MILWHFDWRFFLFFPFFLSIPHWVCWESIFPGWDEMRSKLTFNNLWLLWAFRKHTLLDFHFSLFSTSCIFLLHPSYTVWETHSYTEGWEIMQKLLLTKNLNSSIFFSFSRTLLNLYLSTALMSICIPALADGSCWLCSNSIMDIYVAKSRRGTESHFRDIDFQWMIFALELIVLNFQHIIDKSCYFCCCSWSLPTWTFSKTFWLTTMLGLGGVYLPEKWGKKWQEKNCDWNLSIVIQFYFNNVNGFDWWSSESSDWEDITLHASFIFHSGSSLIWATDMEFYLPLSDLSACRDNHSFSHTSRWLSAGAMEKG